MAYKNVSLEDERYLLMDYFKSCGIEPKYIGNNPFPCNTMSCGRCMFYVLNNPNHDSCWQFRKDWFRYIDYLLDWAEKEGLK